MPYAYYIGLKRNSNASNTFWWDDGTQLSNVTAWWAEKVPSNPLKEYVVMGKIHTYNGDLKWRNVANIKARFICERNKGTFETLLSIGSRLAMRPALHLAVSAFLACAFNFAFWSKQLKLS